MCTVLSCFSHVWLFAILWTVAHKAPLSMGFSRQEYWSGLSCPPPGDLPNPGIKPVSLMSLVLAGRFFTTSTTWETHLFQVLALSASMSVIYSSRVFTSNSICFREEEKPPHNSPPCCSGCSHLRASLLAIPFAGELPSPPNPLQDLTPMSPSQWGLPCTSDSPHPALLVPKFLSPSKEQKTSLLQYRVFCMLLISCSVVSMDYSTPGFPVLHHFPQFAQTMSIESVMPSNHLMLCHPFSSRLQSFPASGSFPMSQLFASGGQSTRASASASVLPMDIQAWFPLGLTSLISLLPKGLSRVFSTVQRHQFFSAQPSSQSNSHIHTWPQEKP